ncbi:MAG: hypothetical protein ACRC0F_00840, partial [Cetobacterium sp.]
KNDIQLNTYKNIQEKFTREIMTLAEKMLGIKIFFDHATNDGKFPAGLLITNCKLRDITENLDILEKFENFIEIMNKNQDQKFYFSIIPNTTNKMLEEAIEDSELEGEKEGANQKIKNANKMVSVKAIVDILAKNRVLTFFNLSACKETSFNHLKDKEILNDYREMFKLFGKDVDINKQISFVYPNFTILPDSVGHIELGKKYGEESYLDPFSDDEYIEVPKEDRKYCMFLPGGYIDASYVAAGLTAGYQNPEFLKENNYKVKNFIPGVRFNIEESYSGLGNGLFAKFNKEGNIDSGFKIKNSIDSDDLGFCFWRDKNFDKISVLKARTLNKDNESGRYMEIYKTLVENFIDIYATTFTDHNKGDIGVTRFVMKSYGMLKVA